MGVRYNTIFLVSVAIVFITVPEIFVSIFTSDPAIAAYAIDCLRYYSYGYGFYAIGMTLTQAFNGAGDTDTPTVINFVCFWVIQIPLAYTMANTLGMGPLGVYITIALADALLAITAVVVFRRGQWKLRKV
jgi:Na+-driven multidrug efflux pump